MGARVAFLGPRYSFTHLAALEMFGGDAELVGERGVAGVFRAVEEGRADYGVVPVENSVEGPVGETLDCLASSMLHVYAAAEARITLVLAGSGPRRVYGHPHALGEAREALARLLPGAEHVPAMSTGEAARLAAERGGYCVCSRRAAEAHGLPVVAEGVERGENYTRFIAVSWRDQPERGERTSLLAAIPDRPGALYEWLRAFAERRVNLAMIYSRPIPSRPWHYLFYVDVEGGRLEEKVAGAIEEARARSLFLRVLGSYPVLRGLVF